MKDQKRTDMINAEVQQKIAKPVAEVFEAIIDPAKIINYFVSETTGPLQEGKTLTWTFGDANASVTLKVQKVKKDREIRFTWPATNEGTDVTIQLEPVSDKETMVTITEKGWELNAGGVKEALDRTQGWTHMLLCLKAYLEFDINLRKGLKLSTLC